MVSVAGCHPALVPPDGHCCVTEPRHNSAGSSSDTNWFLPTPSFPAVQVEKGIGLGLRLTAGECPEARFGWSWFRSVALPAQQDGFPPPLPLPKQLVVFGLGDWSCCSPDASVAVDVLVSPGIAPQRVGTLEPACRSRRELALPRLLGGVSSSTPARPFLVPETTPSPVLPADDMLLGQDLEDPTAVKNQSSEVTARASRPGRKDVRPPLRTLAVPCALKPPSGKVEASEAWRKSPVHPKKPRKVLFEPTASERDLEEEDLAVEELQGSPSPRWCHAMCLSDPGTAVLIGGEGVDQQSCKDALWKLETDSDFWLPVGFQLQNAMPSSLHGHTATYDPDTKRIYIFGGIREDKDYSGIYILDTVTWKWLLVAAKGRIPVLTYHSATIYRKELFVFGGTFPKKASLAVRPCSNVLYVFNPEHEIWYQPISEGEKPLPRLGHSATLLKNKLLIFGGRRTSLYLSDMHILDLGFMEYTPVPFLTGQPSARCFHAALAVSDQKVLISGGCNAKGALQDAFVFHLDTLSWSTVVHHDLCSVPRAGHTLLDLTPARLIDVDKENKEEHNLHTVLVFGGSNCAGTFYNSTVKIQLDLG
ncbi:PREDICTED: probable serine/threonine-protein kinase DDB_G0272254 [Nipponia nippon]|uniref:probable serine/threonine-protein kinase DDB_G0272254 n=1 Tax=Nipponia nippon TaxID=128390 RepID=UPI00051088CD|nr:PREDICTED: probable serine/threonine-protein kinase DDB_G0272254 [Nipponia nippon]